jgi:hypothetical protein
MNAKLNSGLKIVLALLIASCATARAAETLTYLDLIKRLTDLERLATLPESGETGAQCSSYDRASQYDAATDKYIKWDANGDGKGFIRQEGDQIVMAEMEGPGCIWRIWSAKADAGHVKIYLDGAAEPAVDLPFSGYFDGKNEPFIGPVLVHEASRGMNNYVPIPFQKSCKVVADKGWGNYYHFTYGTFPKGTKVPTFKRQLSPEESAALAAADKMLATGGTDPAGKRAGEVTEKKIIAVEPGKSTVIANLTGPRAVTGFRAKFAPGTSPADREELRELVLKITWDDDREPAVWTPLGDFFGTAAGANKYRSLPVGVTDDGGYCFWYMPFAQQARIELINDGKEKRELGFEITHAPLTTPVEKIARFHAKWHRDAFLPAAPERKIDWTMLTTTGRGRFVGVMLHVWNPKGGWWGEGDEKFFVDGEKFPSTFGTGSEDYFGYAWSSAKLFEYAYHSLTIAQGNKGHVSVNRWHITDNVPFQTGFEADIEKYFPNTRPTLFANLACWYLAPGGKDPYELPPLDQRVGYWEALPVAPKITGAIEGEDMKVISKTAGNAQPQGMGHFQGNWSNETQLWWTGAKPGDKLVLALPVAKAGKYELRGQFTKAIDYGIMQLALDGTKLGQPIDFFNDGVIPTGELVLGTVELTAGEHQFTVEITGANAKAKKAYMFGLDYLRLQPAP